MEDLKKDTDNNKSIIGDFNTLLSKKDRPSKQNINKDIVAGKNVLDWGVKFIFTGGHISLTVAFKGLNVISTP